MSNTKIRFAAIGLDHFHIYMQVDHLIQAGGELVSFYAKDPAQISAFSQAYPQAILASSIDEILEDRSIDLIASASIPYERAPLGIQTLLHGKDFMVDKPGLVSLEQLEQVRQVQKETKRIYSIFYSERFADRATTHAGELVRDGAIGKVIQTIGLGPHKIGASRPEWFYQKKKYGGILVDIASHQFDQFLFFTGSTQAEVTASQVGNFHHPQSAELEDFGDCTLRGNGGLGYARVDWFTPDGLGAWGDGRLFILGTDGFIELRKNIDLGGRPGGSHLFLVDQKGTHYIDSSNVLLTYGANLINDIRHRTETAMSQDHCFLAVELSIQAEMKADRLGYLKLEPQHASTDKRG